MGDTKFTFVNVKNIPFVINRVIKIIYRLAQYCQQRLLRHKTISNQPFITLYTYLLVDKYLKYKKIVRKNIQKLLFFKLCENCTKYNLHLLLELMSHLKATPWAVGNGL